MRHNSYHPTAGLKTQPHNYRYATEQYDMFQVIYISQGELVFSDDYGEVLNGRGRIVLLRNLSRFVLSTPRVGYRGVYFAAIGNLPRAFIGLAEALRGTPEIRTLARLMESQIASPSPDCDKILIGLGRAMAWEAIGASRACGAGDISQSPAEWARSVKAALDATLYGNVGSREALEGLPMSYRQLSRHFSDTFGLSPKRYQLEAKIAEVSRLLSEGALSITHIAMELGFASSQHLSTQYKAVTGKAPSDVRRM
jgi:hypothetical protein